MRAGGRRFNIIGLSVGRLADQSIEPNSEYSLALQASTSGDNREYQSMGRDTYHAFSEVTKPFSKSIA